MGLDTGWVDHPSPITEEKKQVKIYTDKQTDRWTDGQTNTDR